LSTFRGEAQVVASTRFAGRGIGEREIGPEAIVDRRAAAVRRSPLERARAAA